MNSPALASLWRTAHTRIQSRRLWIVVLALCFAATPLFARRLPTIGGQVVLAVNPEMVQPVVDAHLYAPFLRPVSATSSGDVLASAPQWQSAVLKDIRAVDGGKQWRLWPRSNTTNSNNPPITSADLVVALQSCFATTNSLSSSSWINDVLRAIPLKIDIEPRSDGSVTVSFLKKNGTLTIFGPFIELLASCPFKNDDSNTTGAFRQITPGVLEAVSQSIDNAPLLQMLSIRRRGERADVSSPEVNNSNDDDNNGNNGNSNNSSNSSNNDNNDNNDSTQLTGTLYAPFPDVILLLQSTQARQADWLSLGNKGEKLAAFRQALRAPLLLSLYGAGRGSASDGILPSGIAPPRPLPTNPIPSESAPLILGDLPPDAPVVEVYRNGNDSLLTGVVDRLAVLLRTRGKALRMKTMLPNVSPAAIPADGIEILRWRPSSTDPTLALLGLAGQHPSLRTGSPAIEAALNDERLLSPKKEERVAAALVLERAWLESQLVVPLLTVERWFDVDPELRNVRIRADGVPIFDDAFWNTAR